MEKPEGIPKPNFKVTIKQGFFDGIFNFIGMNIVIYLFLLKFSIWARIFAVLAYSVLNTIIHVKSLTISDSFILVKYPMINRNKIIQFDKIIRIHFFNKELSRKAEYMDLEIEFLNSKNRKKKDDIPLKDFKEAKMICLFLKSKVDKKLIKSNDPDINKIICQK